MEPGELAAREPLNGAAGAVRLLPRQPFAPRPADEDGARHAEYGSEFVSVVEQPPVYGLQSHPEKSGPDGLRLLKNFVSLAVAQAAGARGAAMES